MSGVVNLSNYGFKSRAEFLRTKYVPVEVFESIAHDLDWRKAKSVLLHEDCPLYIRDRFASCETWYKRYTALFSKSAPSGYYKKASAETDKRLKAAFIRAEEANWQQVGKAT
jgi:hypothetical protein